MYKHYLNLIIGDFRLEFSEDRPLYLQVKEDIMGRLNNGEWSEGEYIPTENDFINHYKISRGTIRRALGEIESDGIIERCPGKGTIVSRQRIKPELLKISSFSQDMVLRGMKPKSITVDLDFQIPPKRVQEELKLSSGEKVWRIKRLRLADDEPMGIQDLYIPPDLKFSARDLQNIQSYYECLEREFNLKPIYCNENLTATIANETEAELLMIEIGDPLIIIWRTTFSDNNYPIEVVKNLFIARRFEYDLKFYNLDDAKAILDKCL